MNTLSIIVIILAVCYSIFLGWTVRNYKAELKKELNVFRQSQGIKLICKDIHIEELKDAVKRLSRENKSLKNQVKLLTPTEPDGM